MEEKTLKAYEIGYLVRSEDAKGALIDHLKRSGGQIVSDGEIRSIKLAYPIEHLPSAYFGYLHFEVDPSAIPALTNALKLDNQIVRFLIVTPPFLKDKNLHPSTPGVERRAKTPPAPEARPAEEPVVSNDLLEEKLEEILNK